MSSRKYTPEQVDRALLELVLAGGNSGAASGRLATAGIEISDRRLRSWRNELYAERYRQIAADHAKQVEETIVTEAMETAVLAAEVERAALARTLTDLEAGNVRDAAAVARNAATVKGINVDKMLNLLGRPTQIVEVQNPDDALRELVGLGIFKPVEEGEVIDGEVIEIPDDLAGLLELEPADNG